MCYRCQNCYRQTVKWCVCVYVAVSSLPQPPSSHSIHSFFSRLHFSAVGAVRRFFFYSSTLSLTLSLSRSIALLPYSNSTEIHPEPNIEAQPHKKAHMN